MLRIAEKLATNPKRPVLLLLAIRVLREKDASTALQIANMLPVDHPGMQWALAEESGTLGDTALDELETLCVVHVFSFMQPKEK